MGSDDKVSTGAARKWALIAACIVAVVGLGLGVFVLLPGAPTAVTPPAQQPAASTTAAPKTDRSAQLKAQLEAARGEAGGQGLSEKTIASAVGLLSADDEVLEAAVAQPEHARTTGDYVGLLVSPERIARGLEKLSALGEVLARIETAYGVERHVLVAIWGVESNYGERMGERSVIRSLATLAAGEPRRQAFWRKELLAALQIVEAGDKTADAMTGSWAGAMGHTQFMPSTYLAHAVDFDGDGRRDIWASAPDALASAANYLKVSGWRPARPWGIEAVLPAGFDPAQSDPSRPKRTWSDWRVLGMTAAAGAAVVADGQSMQLILPAGANGPAFLVTDNFRAILRYNNATSYALAIGHLADRLAGGGAFRTPWPEGDRALSQTERMELQKHLAALGHDTGGVDGVLGVATRAAIRVYQRAVAVPEDGYPSHALLEKLRREAKP